MKNHLLALVGLGMLMATSLANAQSHVVKANIPFNFIVENAMLPGGNYVFHDLSAGSRAMTIQSADRKLTQTIVPNACESNSASRTTSLLFRRYGDQYFLSQIWTEGAGIGRQLSQSRREAEAAMSQEPLNIVVIATLR
jgi:hypothetical protein